MTAAEIQILIGSIGGLIVALAAGGKWVLNYIDVVQARAAEVELRAREKLSERLYEELRVLRQELVETQATNRLCLRRIYQLEGFIHKQPGIESPAMDGWPPAG